MIELSSFADSLSSQQANTFIFGMDNESLNFLIDFNTRSESIQYYSSISSDAKKKFVNYLKLTFYKLGTNYKPVVITDGFRDAHLQMIRMTETKSLAYYLIQVKQGGESWHYITFIKSLYDSKMTKEEMIQFIDTDTNTVFTDRGKDFMKKHLIPNNFASLQTTLEKMLEEKRVFTPTFHMLGQALDLSDNGDLRNTAQTVLKVAGQEYDSDHVHLNLN